MLDPVLLASIADLELVARVMVDGTVSGLHRSPFHGYSAEFSHYRHYRPGDDLKHVDWKLFARTDRLYTKQYRETTNMIAQLAIDGTPPNALTAAALAPFDAVLVGAPEELRAAEVEALDAYAHVRGGAVVFLPDRRPSGSYVTLLPAAGFEELLLENGLPLQDGRATGVSASELALPQRLTGGGVAVASVVHQGATRAVIASWPRGPGRIVFSGALDAWRYRARDEDAFARFWTSAIANVAAASALRLSVSVRHAIAAPDEPIAVRAVIRRGGQLRVEASLVAADGAQRFIRLWPLAEPGVFEGVVIAPAGRYVVRVSGGDGATAETPLIVAHGVRHPPELDEEALGLLAAATGGVVSTSSDLGPVARHLRALRRPETQATLYPMRSVWWSLAFAAALCGEWALARRRGAR